MKKVKMRKAMKTSEGRPSLKKTSLALGLPPITKNLKLFFMSQEG